MKFKILDIVVVNSGQYKDRRGVVTFRYPKYMIADKDIYLVEFSPYHSGQFDEDQLELKCN